MLFDMCDLFVCLCVFYVYAFCVIYVYALCVSVQVGTCVCLACMCMRNECGARVPGTPAVQALYHTRRK